MARLAIHLLGPFQVSLDSLPITGFESNKVRALLAYLAVESRQSHHREKLADLLWPELPARRAISNLNQAVYNLRRLVHDQPAQPPYLLRSRETLQFNPQSDYWLDVEAFTGELGDVYLQSLARQDLGPAACQGLQAAVELYRGDFLAGLAFDSSLAFDEWVLTVRYRLQRLALRGLHRLVDFYAGQEDLARATPYAWRQVQLDPLDEPACRQLMELLAASGQRNQALAHCERLQALLAEELKVAPEPETLALRDQIRGELTATPTAPAQSHNLPAMLTPLIGRRHELAAVQAQLEDPATRLLTLLGPGGSGKSRLALAVAQASLDHFPHGVFFVPLNPLQSPETILPAILEALHLPRLEHESHLDQLTRYLREKDLLLVLDGFEHLLTGAGWLAELLRQAPGLKLLVTSRTRLNLKDEQLYPLAGMRFPPQSASAEEILASDAVKLLLAGLRRARPEYEPAPAEAADLWQVCRQVQGMPLGLLLAASWGATLSLAEIASEVCRGLDFLEAEWADVPARQRSLRATFDHTWRLLEPRQQAIFRGLSVFHGAFTRQAARAVCQASPHELRALVERSLVLSATPGWYELHELLRQYGCQKLAESTEVEQEVCSRHSAYFLERLARWGEALKGPGQVPALANLDREHENTRAAWNRAATQGAVERLAPVVDDLCLYYDLAQRHQEGANACQVALAGGSWDRDGEAGALLHLRLQIWLGRFTRSLGHLAQARNLRAACQSQLERAAEAGLDARGAQALLHFERAEALFRDDLAAARVEYRRSLARWRELDQPWWAALVRLRIAICDLQIGDFDAAQTGFTTYLDEMGAEGDPRHRAYALERLAFLHVRRGNLDASLPLIDAAVAVYRALGDQDSYATSLSALGLMLGWHGRYQESFDLLDQCLPIYQDLGDHANKAFIPVALGMMLTFLGRYPEAESWLSQGISQCRDLGLRRMFACGQMARGWAALRGQDNGRAQAALEASVAEYRQIAFQDELGWALAALAQVNLARGEVETGLEQLRESLGIGLEIGGAMTVRFALGPAAVWIGRQGDPVRALALYSLAGQNPGIANAAWFGEVYGPPIAELAVELEEEERRAARVQGQQLDLWATAAELLADPRLRPGPSRQPASPGLAPAAVGTERAD